MARAWLVITGSGFEAVFLDEARAADYAARTRGVVKPLYLRDTGC